MDLTPLLNLLLATDRPVLPDPANLRLALHAGWALVLGAGVLTGAGRLAPFHRWAVVAGVMIWTLLPGPVSPAYWLGLAFQMPSLMTVVLAGGWLIHRARFTNEANRMAAPSAGAAWSVLRAFAILLGWVLLADALACLPLSVYAWGFSSAAVVVAVLCTGLLGAVPGRQAPGWPMVGVLLGVLTLFVLTRWPSGNLWDALIDPGLWLVLQLGWLVSAWRRWSAATRA